MARGSGKLNFAIALKMTTSQFKKGADIVKKSLRSIQYQVLGMASALGLGTIGLSNLAKEFINIARETNRARVALGNISDGAEGFKRNMDVLTNLANKYGQELNGVTSSFARFSAASNAVGMSLQDQYKIYEAMTKAITAFGLTSSEAQLTYMALGQMMSKGKVTAEELRRQMGERIPIAMEAMARAAGVTIQELDNLLKRGEVYSAETLPKFADELNKMLGDINVDNIETSLNRLRNAFIALTEDLKVGDLYKKIIDGATKMLSNIQQTFVGFAASIASAILTGKIAKAIQKFIAAEASQRERLVQNVYKAEKQKELAAKKRIDAVKSYEKINAEWEKANLDQRAAMYASYERAKTRMTKAQNRERAAINNARLAQEELTAYKSVSIWRKAGAQLKSVAKGVGASLKAMMASFLPMLAIGAITNFIFKLRELRKEAQRIRDIYKSNAESIFNVPDTSEIQRLNTLHKIVENRLGTEKEINAAQDELLRLLGVEHGKQVDLNQEVAKRIRLLREAARADLAAQNNAQLEQRNREIVNKVIQNGDAISFGQFYSKYQAQKGSVHPSSVGGLINNLGRQYGLKTGFGLEFANLIREYEQNTRTIEYNNKLLEDAVRAGIGLSGGGGGTGPTPTTPTTPTADEKVKLSDLQKAEQRYLEQLQILTNQREAGVITQEEHAKALDALNEAIYKEIGGIEGVNAINNEIFRKAKQGVENPLWREPAAPEYVLPERGSRDTTFDYKKSQSDILAEGYRLQEQFVQQLERDIEQLGEQAAEAIRIIDEEQEKLTSLSDSLKLAQLKEDIEALNKDIFRSSIDGFTGLADAIDRAASAWKRLSNWDDMSEWEKVVAIINAMGDTIKGLIGAWENYNNVKEMVSQREQARASLKVVNDAREAASEAAKSATVVASSAAVTEAKKAEATANTAAAATGAASSVAGIPIVGAAMAVAAVASIIGALTNLPKFAKGGIVGGSTRSGDKQLIRANSGEMILTTAQQSNLFKAIKENRLGGGGMGNVKFIIKGKDLEGVLANNNVLRNRR
jgi:tape measure domain-containing protein